MFTPSSKLSRTQRKALQSLKGRLAHDNGMLFSFPEMGLTVCMEPEFQGSRMAQVSLAWCNPREPKFHKDIGEFHALESPQFFNIPVEPEYYHSWAIDFARNCEANLDPATIRLPTSSGF